LSFSFRCVSAICIARRRRSAGLCGQGFSSRGSSMASAEGGQPQDLGASRCAGGLVISPMLLCTLCRLSFRPFPCPSVLRMAGEALDKHYTSRRQPWAPLQARHKSMRSRQQSVVDRRMRSFIQNREALLVNCDLLRHRRSRWEGGGSSKTPGRYWEWPRDRPLQRGILC
jgi:hypothetical protein